MSLEWHTFPNPDETRREARLALMRAFHMAGDRPILFLSSGGSALDLLEDLELRTLPSQITLTVLDERWTTDHQGSNFHALWESKFMCELVARGAEYLDPRPQPDESIVATTVRFEDALRAWRSQQEDWVIIATIGIGSDGHTAGIFPMEVDPEGFTDLFEDGSRWVAGYETITKTPYPRRITTTLAFLLNAVDEAIVYAVGEEKQPILDRMKNGNESLARLPAQALTHLRRGQLFTDQPT